MLTILVKTLGRGCRVEHLLLLAAGWMATAPCIGSAQETVRPTPPQVPPAETSDELQLMEGLLDLLNSPPPPSSSSVDPNVPSSSPSGENSNTAVDPGSTAVELRPADVGLDGEDLGEDQANPIAAIRQSMFIAAGYLERGVTSTDTQTIQRDIVQRLDDLIAQLDQTESERNSQSEQQQQAAPEQQQAQQESPQSQSSPQDASTSDETKPNAAATSDSSASTPGDRGAMAEAILQLTDPAELQQSLWGQLPERVRKQMQSRMVERFLPSYRDQIEAYFQALLKQERE